MTVEQRSFTVNEAQQPITRRDWLRLGGAGLLMERLGVFAAAGLRGDEPAAREPGELPGYLLFSSGHRDGQDDSAGVFKFEFAAGAMARVDARVQPGMRLSPDGRDSAFVRLPARRDQPRTLHVLRIGPGAEPREIAADPELTPYCLSWSPDGSSIVSPHIKPTDEGPRCTNWLIAADGSGRKALPISETDVVIDQSRADGRFVTKVIRRRGRPHALDLYVMDVDGHSRRRIVEGGAIGGAWFDPEGKRIAYLDGDESHNRISVVSVEGGEPSVVFRGRADRRAVVAGWSPDGRWIAYALLVTPRDEAGRPVAEVPSFCGIDVIAADGSSHRELPVSLPLINGLEWRLGRGPEPLDAG